MEEKKDVKFLPRFSYTKLDCEDQCGWKYKLQYVDKNYIYEDTLATELGTLTHAVLEAIARDIMAGREIDYAKYKDMFVNIDKPKQEGKTDVTVPNTSSKDEGSNIFGVKILSKKYREDFYDIDPVTGESYYQKCQQFLAKGIYGLENFMKENPDLEIYDVEHEFLVPYEAEIDGKKTTVALYGFIDRILRNKKSGEFIIEDIKTKGRPFDEAKLKTPLQFVTYAIGLKTQLNLDDYPSSRSRTTGISCPSQAPCAIGARSARRTQTNQRPGSINAPISLYGRKAGLPNPGRSSTNGKERTAMKSS